MINATKAEPIPGTPSSDFLIMMDFHYPEIVALTNKFTTPISKNTIRQLTQSVGQDRIIQKSSHTECMSQYTANNYLLSNRYLQHASKFFPLEISIHTLAKSRIESIYPMPNLARNKAIPLQHRFIYHFCNAIITNGNILEGAEVSHSYHELFVCPHFEEQRIPLKDILETIITLTLTPTLFPYRIPILLGRQPHPNDPTKTLLLTRRIQSPTRRRHKPTQHPNHLTHPNTNKPQS